MVIHGIERKFRRTVWATVKLAELAPDGDLSKIDVIFDGKLGSTAPQIAKFISILATADEKARKYENPAEEEPAPLTVDELLALSSDEFIAAEREAIAAFLGDAKTTVKTEPREDVKKNEAEPEK